MKARQNLRRPENWQDFESLCKKLWGEIWKCPEIQKNGRLGQDQSGVDIFGVPTGEDGYFGIQCKGKSEYFGNQFSEAEISAEVEKAKAFLPALKKYYLATTALNDSKIQSFVRNLNLEHIKIRLFEVHLFCWETIVDLIDENRETYDWYVNSQNYKTAKSISVTFADGSMEQNVQPLFYKLVKLSDNPIQADSFGRGMDIMNKLTVAYASSKKVNRSFVGINLRIRNTGSSPIKNVKIIVELVGEVQGISDTNETGGFSIVRKIRTNLRIDKTAFSCEIIPEMDTLVGDDSFLSDKIFLKPKPVDSKILLKWKLISEDFKTSGELSLNITPKIKPKPWVPYVGVKNEVIPSEGDIEDYILIQSE